MDHLLKLGRIFFAAPFIAFGIEHLIFPTQTVKFVPPWVPGTTIIVYLIGLMLIAAGISIATNFKSQITALLLGIALFVVVVIFHIERLAPNLQDGVERTRTFETLALSGGALALAGILQSEISELKNAVNLSAKVGRFFFAISTLIFGIDHFQYAIFVAAVIPAWIPGHMFFAYFTGAAFIAAAISILIERYATLSMILLGIMFLSWVVVLHAPRVIVRLHNGDEWASAFMALAMSGCAFTLARSMRKETGYS